jgi:hypothetical protein
MEYFPNKYFFPTPGVGVEFLVDGVMFLHTQHIYVGVRDLDLGSMINLLRRVNKT